MTLYDTDPKTGMPVLPKGQRWKVSRSSYQARSTFYSKPRDAFAVSLQFRTLGFWWTRCSDYVYDNYGTSLPSYELSEESIRISADRVLVKFARDEEERAEEVAQRSLLGNYPPKRLGKG